MSESLPPRLPEWLANVPMGQHEQTLVPIGESGKYIAVNLLAEALDIEVRGTIGTFSMSPELAQLAAELTENPNWKNLASEPTTVTRKAPDEWEVNIGELTATFDKEGVLAALEKAVKDDIGE